MRIAFHGTSASIEVPDRPEFLDTLRAVAIDWPFAEAADNDEPLVTVLRTGGKYAIVAPGEEVLETSAVSAACSVVVDVVKAYIDENPSRLCFHCGSVVINGRLVLFPNQYRAGKSTLVARLAASGHEIYGDDVLPLSEADDHGVALGVAPRLRLPLPENAGAAFRRFVTECSGPRDDRYLYLRLPQGSLAPRNSTAPLGAVVLLDRRPRGPASLSEASRSATLQALIVRNFARAAPAGDLLERLHRVMDRLPRFTLHYSDLDEAASLLEATFSAWPPRIGALASADPPLSVVDISSDGAATRARLAGVRLKQNPAVKLHAVDGELFLADAEGTAIHHLNAIGAGLWNLLADAIDEVEAVEVLCGAFPAVERAMVARDVRELFDALAAGGFIVETLPPADCNGTGIPS